MKENTMVMVTKLSGNSQEVFSIGEEIVGPIRIPLVVGGRISVTKHGKYSGITTSSIKELKKTGNVYLVKTRNSIYLVQSI